MINFKGITTTTLYSFFKSEKPEKLRTALIISDAAIAGLLLNEKTKFEIRAKIEQAQDQI
jgi:hypothetical protein